MTRFKPAQFAAAAAVGEPRSSSEFADDDEWHEYQNQFCAVFWPDELEAGPCYRIPSVVQTRVGSLVAFAEARHGRWSKAASALLSSSASAAWKACGGLGRRASAG